eukprot:CAMPEP_0177371166 /NCGR_PEP_ID=MMETSP0368-20130122/42376_1 /TAXON_ID=447022 ORGANISM="Scrippsiella hangoei-like, Strain SHHI-4" /NCGR_SAMPLE_ID=MMETSP0368 /ASSEMBLY_ACC=CAM_ASM_000363 /LENGTH=126 /DNA_ID=CAMNT_0018834471 /DNA_START=74 /DNA_END=455 /DNA_ORIENTATION=-
MDGSSSAAPRRRRRRRKHQAGDALVQLFGALLQDLVSDWACSQSSWHLESEKWALSRLAPSQMRKPSDVLQEGFERGLLTPWEAAASAGCSAGSPSSGAADSARSTGSGDSAGGAGDSAGTEDASA